MGLAGDPTPSSICIPNAFPGIVLAAAAARPQRAAVGKTYAQLPASSSSSNRLTYTDHILQVWLPQGDPSAP